MIGKIRFHQLLTTFYVGDGIFVSFLHRVNQTSTLPIRLNMYIVIDIHWIWNLIYSFVVTRWSFQINFLLKIVYIKWLKWVFREFCVCSNTTRSFMRLKCSTINFIPRIYEQTYLSTHRKMRGKGVCAWAVFWPQEKGTLWRMNMNNSLPLNNNNNNNEIFFLWKMQISETRKLQHANDACDYQKIDKWHSHIHLHIILAFEYFRIEIKNSLVSVGIRAWNSGQLWPLMCMHIL